MCGGHQGRSTRAAQQRSLVPASSLSLSVSLLCLGSHRGKFLSSGFWQSRMGEEPRSCWLLPRLCQRGARMADSTTLTLHPFNTQKTSQILFAFSDSDLLNYCKLGPESGTASHVHTRSHSTQTPQKELKQPPAPPEHLLCSEVFDRTHSAWVNDDGAAKGG